MKIKKALGIIVVLLVAIFISLFLRFIISVDYTTSIPVEQVCNNEKSYFIADHLKNINKTNLLDSFPYHWYVDSAGRCNINSIKKDLEVLDSVNPAGIGGDNQQILSIALTNKLEEKIKPEFEKYNPDGLIKVLQWAEKFNYYSDIEEKNATLYQVIYTYWLTFISNKLSDYYKIDQSLKYNFKFKYLNARCKEKQFGAPINNSNTEKIINNLIENNWTYLFSRFWNDSDILIKLIGLIALLVVFIPYLIIYRIIKKNKQ